MPIQMTNEKSIVTAFFMPRVSVQQGNASGSDPVSSNHAGVLGDFAEY
jgi:hypothetical protein